MNVGLAKQAAVLGVAAVLLLGSMPNVWAAAPQDSAGSSGTATAAAAGGTGTNASSSNGSSNISAKITKDQALAIAKQDVNIPSDYSLQSINFNNNQGLPMGGTPSWSLYFSQQSQTRYSGSINVTIAADSGKLLSFYVNDYNPNKPAAYPPKVDYAGAKAIAEAYIKKLDPVDWSQLRFNATNEQNFKPPLQGTVQYPIRFDRVVNGILYDNNGITVTVDGDGNITNYTFNWDDNVEFADASNLLSQAQAMQLFKQKQSLSLQYVIPYSAKDKTPQAAYQLSMMQLDAKTGDPVSWSLAAGSSLSADPLSATAGPAPADNGQKLTQDQAVKAVTDIFSLPSGAKLNNASYNENKDPATGLQHTSWNLSWIVTNDSNSQTSNIWANVDGQTGEIKNFSHYLNMTPADSSATGSNPKLTQDDARKIAEDLVKKLAPEYTNQLYLSNQSVNQPRPLNGTPIRDYNFIFVRKVGGVLANNEQVSVDVDANTGDIRNYYNGISDVQYPQQPPKTIPADQAMNLLLSEYSLELHYVLDPQSLGNLPGIYGAKYNAMAAAGKLPPGPLPAGAKPKAIPVYQWTVKNNDYNNLFLDAVKGVWKQRDTGEVANINQQTATDLQGHWAAQALQIMIDYNAISVTDGKVYPDKAITRGELIKMLVTAMNSGNPVYYGANRKASYADVTSASPYFAYVENAVDRNLIDPGTSKDFNPNALVTRDDLSELITRALGYEQLAQYTSIFNLQAKDAAQIKHKGDAAIVVGLDIMSLKDGKFRPDETVSRAMAASAFYRYLQKRPLVQGQGFN